MAMKMDDYHEYMMICEEDEFESSGSSSGSGCSSGCLPWILGVLALLWLISKLG